MLRRTMLKVLAATAVAVSVALAGCGGGSGSGGNTVKIGCLESMTGTESSFGVSTQNGYILAAEEWNKNGGVLGKQIELVLSDDQSNNGLVKECVQKLIDQDKVVAILGEVASGRTNNASPECQRRKIPLLTPSSTRNDVTEAGDYIFRSCFRDALQGKWMVEIAADKLHAKTAALLVDDNSDYSSGLGKVITEEFQKKGGTILTTEHYDAKAKDFRAQLTNIRGKNPEVVFLPGYYNEVVTMLPQARELGIKVPFVGGDGWDAPETLKIDPPSAVNGCIITNHYSSDDPSPRVQEFIKTYRARFNNTDPDAMAVTGYDAANLLFDAIKRAGSAEGPKIRDALAQTKNFPGIAGDITIGPDRNAIKPGVALEIENGHYKLFAKVGESDKAEAAKP